MNRLQMAEQMRMAVQTYITALPEEQAITVASVYPEWRANKQYYAKDWVKYGVDSYGDTQLYQVLQDHISMAEWSPDVATGLFKAVGVAEDGTRKWSQPCGVSDAYMAGDIVDYNGVKYISDMDYNVWEPTIYGWSKCQSNVADDVKDFVQPTGAHDAYSEGDKVRYNGSIYESLINGNVYAPDVYTNGWRKVE